MFAASLHQREGECFDSTRGRGGAQAQAPLRRSQLLAQELALVQRELQQRSGEPGFVAESAVRRAELARRLRRRLKRLQEQLQASTVEVPCPNPFCLVTDMLGSGLDHNVEQLQASAPEVLNDSSHGSFGCDPSERNLVRQNSRRDMLA